MIIHQRFRHSATTTVGGYFLESEQFAHIIEDQPQPRGAKVMHETRIWSDLYKLRKRTWGRYASAAKRRWNHPYVIEIVGVHNFTDVLIHWGRHHGHTSACQLAGLDVTNFFGDDPQLKPPVRDAYCVVFEEWLFPYMEGTDDPRLLVLDEGCALMNFPKSSS